MQEPDQPKTTPYKTGMIFVILGSIFAVAPLWVITEFFAGLHDNFPLMLWCIGAFGWAIWMVGKGANYLYYYGRHQN